MKRKCFAFLCVLSLCVPLLAKTDTTEITYMCESCEIQDICDMVDTRLEAEGEALMQYFDVCCRHCGKALFEGARQVGTVTPEDSGSDTPQSDPPADPPTESAAVAPVDPDPPADTGSGDSPAVVVQPQPQSQSESQPAARPEEPVTLPSSSGGDSGSSSGSGPAVAVQPQSQPQTQSQTQPAARPEEPVTLPSSSGDSSGSSGGTAQAVTVVEAPASQAQPEALSPVVVGGEESSAQPDDPGGEGGATGQDASPEDPDPETDDPLIDTNRGEHIPPEKTRNYDKYPLFSVYYPSRRLNMEGDPDAWANIPGEKIYPISGTSLLAEMLNGGQ